MAYGGGLGVEAEKRKKKRDENHFWDEWIILGRECKKEGGGGIEKRRRGRWQERGVLHDFKLTIIVGCDMYYVSRGSES